MTIETKFKIGDKVFRASYVITDGKLPCPDCNDTKTWQAVSGAGIGYLIKCPRCSTAYQRSDALSLRYKQAKPCVTTHTVAGLEYTSHDWDKGPKTTYQLDRVGSGTRHHEKTLFIDESSAEVAAEIMAKEADTLSMERNRYYVGDISISDYDLTSAKIKTAEKYAYDAKWEFEALEEKLRDWNEWYGKPDNLEELKTELVEFLKKNGRDNPFETSDY